MNTYQLAEYFGCSDDTIGRKLKQHNIQPHKFYEDLTNKRFGKLLVLGKSEKSGRRLYWNCICDCGKTIIVKGDHLRQGHQESCGCLLSKGELEIANILTNNNIMFITQYRFTDFYAETNNIPYRFDFGIIEENKLSYLIEFDGEQHFFSGSDSSWNNSNNFEKTLIRDSKKNNYCFEHNIPLIRIPYFIKGKITLQDLQPNTSNYLVQKE